MVKGVAEEGKRVKQGRNRGVMESGVTETGGKGSWGVMVKGVVEGGRRWWRGRNGELWSQG
jgi:hypothetical protein